MEDVMIRLGKLIVDYREEHNQTMREFARRADLSYSFISYIEKGENPQNKKSVNVTLPTINSIAKALGTTNKELLEKIGYFDNSRVSKRVWRVSEIIDLLPPKYHKIVNAEEKYLGFPESCTKEEIDLEYLAEAIEEIL